MNLKKFLWTLTAVILIFSMMFAGSAFAYEPGETVTDGIHGAYEWLLKPTADYDKLWFCGSTDYVSDSFSEDRWIAENKEEKCGIIDSKGNIIIPCEYDYLFCNDKGVAVTKDGKTSLMDYQGQLIFEYNGIDTFFDNYISVKKDGKEGLIDYNGNTVIPFEYDSLYCYDKGIKAWKDEKCGVIGYNGQIVVPFEYNYLWFYDNYIYVEKIGSCGTLDYNGNIIVLFDEYSALDCSDNIICASKNEKYGAFDYKGNIIIPFEYDWLKSGNYYITAEKDGKRGIIDFKGQVTVPFEYDSLPYPYYKECISAVKDGKWGVINLQGQVIVPFEYDYTDIWTEKYISAGKDGNLCIFDYQGNVVIPSFGYGYGIAATSIAGNLYSVNSQGFLALDVHDDSGLTACGLCDEDLNILFDCISKSPISGSAEAMTFALKTDEGCGIVKISPEKPDTVEIKVTAENGNVSGDGVYNKGDKVTLKASADSGYKFDGFYIDGKSVSTSETYTFTADSDMNIEAKFKKKSSGGGGGGGRKVSVNTAATNTDVQTQTPDVSGKPNKKLVLKIGSKNTRVDDKEVENDVAPIIRNDRTMLPARFIAENLGAKVEWNADEKKVTITNGKTVIEIFIGWAKAYINGAETALDSPAFIENDRTYTPVRFISEALSAEVDWNAETKEVTITGK